MRNGGLIDDQNLSGSMTCPAPESTIDGGQYRRMKLQGAVEISRVSGERLPRTGPQTPGGNQPNTTRTWQESKSEAT